jgi:hypothetical protein
MRTIDATVNRETLLEYNTSSRVFAQIEISLIVKEGYTGFWRIMIDGRENG